MQDQSLLKASAEKEGLVLIAAGSWTAPHARELESAIEGLDPSTEGARSVDLHGVRAFDTYGAWLLERLLQSYEAKARHLEVTGLDPAFQKLFDDVRTTNRPQSAAPKADGLNLLAPFEAVGRNIAGLRQELLPAVEMAGALTAAIGRVIANPRQFRLTSTVNQLDRVGWQAVPIMLLITFLIGAIIAQQGFFHFRKFGAETYTVDMVGILVLRELGVLIVAIMVAGRSGSSYTAELGSMKMREEIDALQTMGRDPVEILILPRIIALVLALPMLAFLGSLAALFGGGVVAWSYGDMSPTIFLTRLGDAISITHFKVGIIKAPFMALAIGLVACSEGLRVKGSAESLGLQTTVSVVKSIFLVIVLDGLFAVFFASIGM